MVFTTTSLRNPDLNTIPEPLLVFSSPSWMGQQKRIQQTPHSQPSRLLEEVQEVSGMPFAPGYNSLGIDPSRLLGLTSRQKNHLEKWTVGLTAVCGLDIIVS